MHETATAEDSYPEHDELPRRARARLLTPLTVLLMLVLFAACGFIGGVLVQKQQQTTTTVVGAAASTRLGTGATGASGASAASGGFGGPLQQPPGRWRRVTRDGRHRHQHRRPQAVRHHRRRDDGRGAHDAGVEDHQVGLGRLEVGPPWRLGRGQRDQGEQRNRDRELGERLGQRGREASHLSSAPARHGTGSTTSSGGSTSLFGG